MFEHFIDVNKLSKRANNAEVEIKDYKLTRYACYLIAQNGDSRNFIIYSFIILKRCLKYIVIYNNILI